MRGGAYHKVYRRIWTDPVFRGMSEDARFLALYLLTCPLRRTEGLFRLPLPFAAYELCWTDFRTTAAMEELEAARWVAWDRRVDVVWVIPALADNRPVGTKQIKGAVNSLAEVPESGLHGWFMAHCEAVCPALAESITEHLGWVSLPMPVDRVSIPIGSPLDTPSNALALTQPPPPADSADLSTGPGGSELWTTDGAENAQHGDAGDPTAVAVGVNIPQLADQLLEAIGLLGAHAKPPELEYVTRALANGHTARQLRDLAMEISAMDDDEVHTSRRAILRGALRKRAETQAPTPPPASSGETWEQAWQAVVAWYRRSGGTVGERYQADSGLTDWAWYAAWQIRTSLATATEPDARQAFRDAYLAEVPA